MTASKSDKEYSRKKLVAELQLMKHKDLAIRCARFESEERNLSIAYENKLKRIFEATGISESALRAMIKG